MSPQYPVISIIMPVFNGALYINEAIESILDQSFIDYEFIIVNDGSSDDTGSCIEKYKDERIIHIQNTTNLGVSASLNKGLQIAKGIYIARMDADDISIKDRLLKQVNFLDSNPNIGVCGSWFKHFGYSSKIVKVPQTHEEIRTGLFFHSPICHPTVMIRKSILDKYKITYNESFGRGQDYRFWSDLIELTQFKNLSSVLLRYRSRQTMTYSQNSEGAQEVRNEWVKKLMGRELTMKEVSFHRALNAIDEDSNELEISELDQWVSDLIQENQTKERYPSRLFNSMVRRYYNSYCIRQINKTFLHQTKFVPSNIYALVLSNEYFKRIEFITSVKLLLKCILFRKISV